jgi:hypothetical protein
MQGTMAKAAIALLGLLVLVTLFPEGGTQAWCYSLICYSVPCGNGLNVALGAATAGAVGLALWLKDRLPKVVVALLAGLVVLVLLFPWGGGLNSNPPYASGCSAVHRAVRWMGGPGRGSGDRSDRWLGALAKGPPQVM